MSNITDNLCDVERVQSLNCYVGTCELEIFVQIESRIESGVVVYVFNAVNNYYYRRTAMLGFSWFLKQYCTIAPTVLASVYALAT